MGTRNPVHSFRWYHQVHPNKPIFAHSFCSFFPFPFLNNSIPSATMDEVYAAADLDSDGLPLLPQPGDGAAYRSRGSASLRERRTGPAGGVLSTVGSALGRGQKKEYERKLDNGELLDNHEQDELIEDIRRQAEFMNLVWRWMMLFCGCFFAFLVAGMLVVRVIVGPERVYLHRELEPVLGPLFVTLLQVLPFCSFLTSAYAAYLLPALPEDILIAAGVSAAVTAGLSFLLLSTKGVLTLSAAWLALTALGLVGGVWYAQGRARSFESDVGSIEKLRYRKESV